MGQIWIGTPRTSLNVLFLSDLHRVLKGMHGNPLILFLFLFLGSERFIQRHVLIKGPFDQVLRL